MLIRKLRLSGIVAGVAALAIALPACGSQSAASQFTVNGHPVSVALYHSIVAAEQHKIERIGARVDWQSAAGQRRRASIESSVIRELVRDAVVEQLAKARGISVTPTDLEQGLSAAEQAFGGPVAFEQNLEQAGLSRSEFSSLLRYRFLETGLSHRDGRSKGVIDKAVAEARVVATIGPCAGERSYPACLSR